MDRFVSLIDAGQDSQCVIKAHLANARGFVLRCIYSSAEEALHDILGHGQAPDLVLVNVQLPGMCGIECTHKLKRILPRLPVVILTQQAELPSFIRAFQAGADGHFTLPGTSALLHDTIKNALDGWRPFSREIQKLLVEHLTHTGSLLGKNAVLTPAEHKIMSYLVLSLSDKEIATFTGNATATVHSIANHIYKKLGVHTRREAVSVYLGFNKESPGGKSVRAPKRLEANENRIENSHHPRHANSRSGICHGKG